MVDERDFEERRSFVRYKVWFPVTLDVAGRPVGAISRDIGAGGIHLSAMEPVVSSVAGAQMT